MAKTKNKYEKAADEAVAKAKRVARVYNQACVNVVERHHELDSELDREVDTLLAEMDAAAKKRAENRRNKAEKVKAEKVAPGEIDDERTVQLRGQMSL